MASNKAASTNKASSMKSSPRAATKAADSSELPTGFADHVLSVVKINNPQQNVGGEPGESELARFVCDWLEKRQIAYTCDLKWGVHAAICGRDGPGEPGVLLSAHMDSDHLRQKDLANLQLAGSTLHCRGEVGLDCKTGIAIALSVLERLQGMPGAWQVHVLFTVGEESGQKGAIRAPIAQLLAGKVRFGVVIDRMTSGSGCPYDRETGEPVRHAVHSYKNVPLLAGKNGEELLRHLNAGHGAVDAAAGARPLPLVESPNCADALEWRGRWDAHVIAPSCAQPSAALRAALAKYVAATDVVVAAMAKVAPDDRVSSMNSHPRYTRYQAMRDVYDALYEGEGQKYDEKLDFSVVNLSYDYDDADDTCDLRELDKTARILLHMMESCFASARAA